jgi:2-polyprenyl-3-methyl-5-hydroxy-6-metoxy-1,4-benzoquinol methylase
MSLKSNASNFLRKSGLIIFFDKLFFWIQYFKNFFSNRKFIRSHPGIVLPPAYFVYETYGMNYEEYYFDGLNTAKELTEKISTYKPLSNLHLLDWGCGPGRITRHFPELLPGSVIRGADYNQQYVNWCNDNLKMGGAFTKSGLSPQLHFSDNYFDVVIALSVFTHLSSGMHFSWIEELQRIIKKDGILIMTTQGTSFRHKLLDLERQNFDKGELVLRENVVEGHRLFSAFQPYDFVLNLIRNKFKVLEFIDGGGESLEKTDQDMWVLEKT